MAKKSTSDKQAQITIPDFVDVDPAAVTAAKDSLKGAGGWSIPKSAKEGNKDKKGGRHFRWQEVVTIQNAYRAVAKSGLMDVTLVVKSRPGSPNEGRNEFIHLYINAQLLAGAVKDKAIIEKHGNMNNQSIGTIATLAEATGLMPKTGGFKASLLNLLFPSKGQPGAKSPLDGKTLLVNVHAQVTMKTVTSTNPTTETSAACCTSRTPASAISSPPIPKISTPG